MQNLKKHLKIPWDLSHSLRIMGIPAVILFRLIAVSMETGRVQPLILTVSGNIQGHDQHLSYTT